MLFLITGASGSGKTSCLDKVRELSADVIWHDFDDVGVPSNADKVWRQRTTEHWLKRAIQNQDNGRDELSNSQKERSKCQSTNTMTC